MEYKCLHIADNKSINEKYIFAGIDTNGQLITDEYDNAIKEIATSKYIQLSRQINVKWETILSNETAVKLVATDSRLVFICKKNALHGKEIIGHIRYEWISRIGFIKKTGRINDGAMQIYYSDSNDNSWVLETHFTRNIAAEKIVNNILRKASGYRLKMRDAKDRNMNEIIFFNEYAKGKSISADAEGNFSYISFPSHYSAPEGHEYRPNENSIFCLNCCRVILNFKRQIKYCPFCGEKII